MFGAKATRLSIWSQVRNSNTQIRYNREYGRNEALQSTNGEELEADLQWKIAAVHECRAPRKVMHHIQITPAWGNRTGQLLKEFSGFLKR
jgi:hypothetical protein